jgi:hypothetical protein
MSPLSFCDACGACFATVALFDLHRIGPFTRRGRRCLSIQQLQAKGLFQNERGVWRYPLVPPLTHQEGTPYAQI